MEKKAISIPGMMTYYQDEQGRHFAEFWGDFEYSQIDPFTIKAQVQAMRDGTLLMSELPQQEPGDIEALTHDDLK